LSDVIDVVVDHVVRHHSTQFLQTYASNTTPASLFTMSAVDYNKQDAALHVEDETASKDKPIYYENANPEGEVLETRYARESAGRSDDNGRAATYRSTW